MKKIWLVLLGVSCFFSGSPVSYRAQNNAPKQDAVTPKSEGTKAYIFFATKKGFRHQLLVIEEPMQLIKIVLQDLGSGGIDAAKVILKTSRKEYSCLLENLSEEALSGEGLDVVMMYSKEHVFGNNTYNMFYIKDSDGKITAQMGCPPIAKSIARFRLKCNLHPAKNGHFIKDGVKMPFNGKFLDFDFKIRFTSAGAWTGTGAGIGRTIELHTSPKKIP